MSERIEWTRGEHSEAGRVGGLRLFTVGHGVMRQEHMYYLRTDLPVKHSSIGQHYPTPTHAKVAAERLLTAFIERLTATPATETREATSEGSASDDE